MPKFSPPNVSDGQGATESSRGTAKFATAVEAANVALDNVMLSPKRLQNAPAATTTRAGVLETATDTETKSLTATDKIVTPGNLGALNATETQEGLGEISTDAEADGASVSTNKFLVPSNLAALTATNLTALKASDAATVTGTSSAVFVTPSNLEARKNFTKVTFQSQPLAVQSDGSTASGVDTETNVMSVDNGVIFEYYNVGTQTVLVPQIAATGLDIARDLTDNEGTEFSQGITAVGKHAYTIGTDGPFYVKATVNAADVSGVDPLVIGFRKTGAYNSTFTSYSDFASIGIVGENDPAALKIVTNLNSAGASTTDTTDTVANGVNVILEVIVSAAGVVTYTIDGVAPTTTAAFTFDSTDVVVPFLHFTHATTTPGAVYLIDYECGLV